MTASAQGTLKDDRLFALSQLGNVAQFISFGPGAEGVRHHRIAGRTHLSNGDEGVRDVLAASRSESVNIRTFREGDEKGQPFIYGITSADDVAASVRAFAMDGFYTIVNETIDVDDGGVSGVALGDVLEFAPGATPRAVESEDVATLPRKMGISMLAVVYGFEPAIPPLDGARVEFSIHPSRVGFLRDHTILWEVEQVGDVAIRARPDWPNKFSRHIGDKTFGLLIAHLMGARVPRTTVVGRRVAPFSFGQTTGSGETWLRTCPSQQEPGLFTTTPHWTDPFALLAQEDPEGVVAAVLAQEGVAAVWSGATLPLPDGHLVEGVAGSGLEYMQGTAPGVALPRDVIEAVERTLAPVIDALGPARCEWAHDGRDVWVLQLHVARFAVRDPDVLSPGEAATWIDFDTADGLPRLRELVSRAKTVGAGVLVRGRVGLTSHVGDVLRKAGVPGRRVLV